MRHRRLIAFLAVLSVADAAHAVSVTNRDTKDHKISIIAGDNRQEQLLKPGDKLEGLCPSGCLIRLNDSENDEYELEGPEIVSIEDGYLYYDGPEAPATAPAASPTGAPAQPPAGGSAPPAAAPPAPTAPAPTPGK
jgi:hypothetical protein